MTGCFLRRFGGLLLLLVAAALTAAAGGQGRLEQMPGYQRYRQVRQQTQSLAQAGTIHDVQWNQDDGTLTFVRGGRRYTLDLQTQQMTDEPLPEQADGDGETDGDGPTTRPRLARGRQRDREASPDGQWSAVCRDFNLWLEPDDGGEPIAVTTDGHRKLRYGMASWVYGEELRQRSAMWWSPDSTRLAFYEFDEQQVPDHYLTGGLIDQHTSLLTEGYPKPGEPNPIARLLIYELDSRTVTSVEVGDDADQYVYDVRFTPDGSRLLFNRTNRRQNVLELVAADPATGQSRVVLTETQRTWQRNRPTLRFLEDGRRFIWETEKTGWRQYELRDLDGRLLNTITRGDYPAGRILAVDEQQGVLYYMVRSGPHPLNNHLHRARLDGTEQVRLTPEGLNHRVTLSPDHDWFISTAQSVETPPTTVLYDIEGRPVATLAEMTLNELEQLGLERRAELFTFTAADGRTQLYGVLYRPSTFDPDRTYPLLLDVYGGPTSQRVRNRFRPARPECEFGFLIAVVDNRGTRGRGKAFEDEIYLRLGSVDLEDQVQGVRHLLKRPYVDADRVGVFGHSYGGYLAALAILRHPDLFRAAVASAPVTDWRNYDTIYTERYMRTPQENPEGYDEGSCLTYADQLRGHLLLMHGMLDDNVHPNNTWQLIDALHQAGRPVDMKLFPRRGHGLGKLASTIRWEYLHDKLVDETPEAAR